LHCSIVRHVLDTNGRSPVEAWKVRQHLLMHVTSAVEPDEPPDLTQQEKRAFRQLAARANAEPWMAKVLMRPDLELVRLDWWPLEALDPRE
ncbi:MAG TPA: hypothetical protein VMT45_13800, partial [Thermoanaerobaculaceae bacterium]|nr:hypothetical protein [Thermoanaerobaculaceae bacterium]